MQQHIKQVLIKYWGFSNFRPMQEEIILSVINQNDTLVLFPTGGGKSLTFQVPAMAMDGVCVVITPLISLMKDQVANLNKKGIPSKAIYSGLTNSEIRFILEQTLLGKFKFLYISPERSITKIFRNYFQKIKINLIAVDEAHCISQWGYDFRPPYLSISELRPFHPKTPIIAVTATATPLVAKDIQEKLLFRNQKVFTKSFYRKNLSYEVYNTEDKIGILIKICKDTEGTGVVYVRSRKKTKIYTQILLKNKMSSDFYHAGLSGQERDKKQHSWTTGKTRIIVATNAFGMGIDKSDVRFVIHMDIPDCIEAYFQEAGRAGRDDNSSRCILLYNNSDIDNNEKQLDNSFPPVDYIKNCYSYLGNYYQIAIGSGNELSFDFEISKFIETFNIDANTTFYALRFLEKEGLIQMSEAIHNPSRVRFIFNHNEIYKYRVENPIFDPFIQMLLRNYPGIFNDYVKIDESKLSKQMEVNTSKVINALNKLDKTGIISYIPYNDKPKITFLSSRINEENINISKSNYHDRKIKAYERFKSMKEFISSSSKCRSIQLLNYFGEKTSTRCGICDICTERNSINLNKVEFDTIINVIKPKIKSNPIPLKDVYDLFPFEKQKKVSEALRWLFDNNIASMNENGIVSWRKGNKE